jgi:hypothetical protein
MFLVSMMISFLLARNIPPEATPSSFTLPEPQLVSRYAISLIQGTLFVMVHVCGGSIDLAMVLVTSVPVLVPFVNSRFNNRCPKHGSCRTIFLCVRMFSCLIG